MVSQLLYQKPVVKQVSKSIPKTSNMVELEWARKKTQQPTYQPTPDMYQLLVSIDKHILELPDKITSKLHQKADTAANYFLNTSETSEHIIDLVKDMDVAFYTMTVLDAGGGFTFKINNETATVNGLLGVSVEDEIINKIYWTGSGTAGTAQLRFSMWMGGK